VTRDEARAQFSNYLENTLTPAARDRMQVYLASDPDAAAELIGLERTLSLLRRLPEREPSLDLWREIAPAVEAYRAERRLSASVRLRGRVSELLSQISAGVILWTSALARRAHHHLSPHLLHDALLHDSWSPLSADKRKD